MKENRCWARLLAYVTGLINQELLLKNEYLAAEIGSCGRTFQLCRIIFYPTGRFQVSLAMIRIRRVFRQNGTEKVQVWYRCRP